MFVTNKRFKELENTIKVDLKAKLNASWDQILAINKRLENQKEPPIKKRLNEKIFDIEDKIQTIYQESKRNGLNQSQDRELSKLNDILRILKEIRA